MLGKLFKYDFRALSRVMRFLILGILCLALLLAVFGVMQIRQDYDYDYFRTQSADQIVRQVLISLILFSFLGMGAAIAVIMVFIYVHYYRSLFSDEGYLTHTLPVKSWEILLSKLLSAVLWALIGYAAIVLGLMIVALCATSAETLFNTEVFHYIGEAAKGIVEGNAVGTVLLVLPNGFASLCSEILQVFLAITIGCAIANKHRIWAAIGIYLAIGVVNGIVNSIFSVPSTFLFLSPMNYYSGDHSIIGSLNIVLLLDLVKNSGIAVGCFFWIKHLMKRRLNLQ